jgi:flagellar hook-associated protein 2
VVSNASISGLVSGLDTATIISQLMQLEAVPQTRLKTQVVSAQSEVTALRALNTKTALLAGKAATLATDTTWAAVSATSSNQSVTVTAATDAQPATFSVTVTSVARTHQLGFATAAALTDQVTGASNTVLLDRLDGSAAVPLDTGDGTLQGLVNAINDPANATGLRATAINTASGYRLLVESTATGASQDFTITAGDGSALLGGATVRAGTDAALDLGLGITATSTTNTFAGLVPGVTLTLAPDTAVGAKSTVGVTRNVSTLSASVADLVTSLNDVLSEIDTDTAYDSTTKTGGVLGADAMPRNLRSTLLNTVFPTDGTSLAQVGISTTRDGKLVFDSAKFAAAYAADPAGTEAKFTTASNGFAERVHQAAETASRSSDGLITAAITGRQAGISRLQGSIADWDTRLALRQESLQRQFTAMETALNQMNSQSSWLSSQIKSLSSGS